MGIKFDPSTNTWEASHSKRHPITRVPKSLKRINLSSRAEAQRVFTELVIEVERKLQHQATGAMLYRELLEKFYRSLEERDLTVKTIENYKFCLDAHTLKLWGHRRIDSILHDEVRKLIKVTLGTKSISHQQSVLKFVRGVFTYAVEMGALSRAPIPTLHFRIADKIKKVLTEPQIKILLDKAKEYDDEWYSIWAAALYTGMRNGELHALTWDKVDLDNRKILVSCSWNKKDGHKDLTKSGEDRVVEIAPPLLIMLKEIKLKNPGVFVLPRIRAWDEGRQAEILRMFLSGINLPRIRFHDLRASWATVLLGQGVPPIAVMKMGGWKDLKTMMIYVRKAGIDICGITNNLSFHDPKEVAGTLIQLPTTR
jgi:integrase